MLPSTHSQVHADVSVAWEVSRKQLERAELALSSGSDMSQAVLSSSEQNL